MFAERYAQVGQYYKLRDDVRSVEVLRRGAENFMRDEPQRTEPKRARDVTL